MNLTKRNIIILSLIAASSAQVTVVAATNLTGKNIVNEISDYVYPANRAATPESFNYMADGESYASLSKDGKTIDVFDIKTGSKTSTLFDTNNTREVKLNEIEGFILSPDCSKVIVWDKSEKIYRRSMKARYYVYEVRTRILRPLSTDFKMTQSPAFSPDSRMVAFVAENNIYIKKLDYNSQVAVTTDGAVDKIINGATDWTYEEEFTVTSTLTWAPDNLTLCYVKFDESEVPYYNLEQYKGSCDPKNQYALYPGTFTYKYPVAGQKNSRVSVHSYDIETRKTKDITLPDSKIEYIPRIAFGPSADCLLVLTLNRDQNRFEIYNVNPRSTVAKSIYVDESKAWIDDRSYENITIQNDGFVVCSNKSGWNHFYKYSYAGALVRTITSGTFDATNYYGEDAQGYQYYQAALPTPMDRTVYRVDKKGVVTALTALGGTGAANFSDNCAYAVYSYSNATTPTTYTLCRADGKKLRSIEDNADYAARYKSKVVDKEFVKVQSDGYELNAYIIKPRNFDASKKYPVVMYQYSGPGSQSVLNKWEMDWMYYFADNGFVVLCVDGRGTGGRGYDFMTKVYRDLGHYETIDQLAGARYIASQSYVDAQRIGIFGWSYGGYETLMAVSADGNPFKAAVAVAPVTDWRFYDTVYTERFMLTPAQNEDGYNASAPLKHADKMSTKLLLMYGTSDDNVHPANTLEYVSALQSNGILCDMLVFPNMNHSIYGCNSRAVVYAKMFQFFKENL